MELGSQVARLREWLNSPCYAHFIAPRPGGDFERSAQMVLSAPPSSLKDIFNREQIIGEARALYALHEKIKNRLLELELQTDKTKREEYERRNAVSYTDAD